MVVLPDAHGGNDLVLLGVRDGDGLVVRGVDDGDDLVILGVVGGGDADPHGVVDGGDLVLRGGSAGDEQVVHSCSHLRVKSEDARLRGNVVVLDQNSGDILGRHFEPIDKNLDLKSK